jgi:threonine/homoserine/homoserine lactone efflux protein
VYIGVALLVDTSYVLAAAAVSRRFTESKVAQRRAAQVAAGTYIALGVAAAVTGDRPA